uniref:GtrA family protein n=1 Tax=Bacteroides thetaiotaomicron TaxID=818 RepID=UPI0039C8A614
MKESVRIFRFIVIGTMNALIMALVVWLMMREMSFEGDYMVANVTAYIIAQIHNFIWCKYWIFPVEKERIMSGNRYYSSVLLSGLLTLRSFYSLFCW